MAITSWEAAAAAADEQVFNLIKRLCDSKRLIYRLIILIPPNDMNTYLLGII